jgi:hypothetical protein
VEISPYKFSAVALIDVLGFKGIDRRHDPAVVLSTLAAARKAISELTDWMNTEDLSHLHHLGGRPNMTVSWFSDTICVVAQLPKPGPLQLENDAKDPRVRAALLEVLVRSVGTMIQEAASNPELPLVFRGVITVGDLVVYQDEEADKDRHIDRRGIYLGPAIEEASELYECADGAFVWLSPEAARLPYLDVDQSTNALVWYGVPTKRGTLRTRVVSPFINMLVDSDLGRRLEDMFMQAMKGDRVDVVMKRQNTRRFLRQIINNDPDLHDSDPEALDGFEEQVKKLEESGADEALFRTG